MDEQKLERRRAPANETRVQDVVHPSVHGEEWDAPWKPPSNLDAPPPLPGMRQRWVRVSIRGEDDPSNFSKQRREGWIPRPADTIPKDFHAPRITEGTWAGCIGVHGVILCHMPEKRVKQREAYYREQTRAQTQAVEADLEKEFREEGQTLDKLHRTKVATGRRPRVAEAVETDDDDI